MLVGFSREHAQGEARNKNGDGEAADVFSTGNGLIGEIGRIVN